MSSSWLYSLQGKGDLMLANKIRSTVGKYELAILLILFALVFVVGNSFYGVILTLVFVWATLGVGWNLSAYAGRFSLGHAAFFGIGGLVSLQLFLDFGIPPWYGVILSGLAASAVALVFGYAFLRLDALPFAFATLTLPLLFAPMVGYFGFLEVPYPANSDAINIFTSPTLFYVISLAILSCALLLAKLVEGSRLGFYLKAIKEDKDAAQASGINIFRTEYVALILGAFISGVAGALYILYLGVFTPDLGFGLTPILYSNIIPILGGMGVAWGPIIGSFVIIPMQEELQSVLGTTVPDLYLIADGIVLIVVISLMPDGIYNRLLKNRFKRKNG